MGLEPHALDKWVPVHALGNTVGFILKSKVNWGKYFGGNAQFPMPLSFASILTMWKRDHYKVMKV